MRLAFGSFAVLLCVTAACSVINAPAEPLPNVASGAGATTGSSASAGAGGSAPTCTSPATLCGAACVDLKQNRLHCGKCGNACTGDAQCVDGKCTVTCGGMATLCGANCVDTRVDPAHCGGCDTVCPTPMGSKPTCVKGMCGWVCGSVQQDCNQTQSDGCETDTSQDLAHCGSCATACPMIAHGAATCMTGKCGAQCDMGFDDCDKDLTTGCEADLNTDNNHCGNCMKQCNTAVNEECISGACKVVPYNFQVLAQKDIVYQGIPYLLLKVKYLSNQSVAANWCQEYTNLCQSFGYVPTGCGQMYTNMPNGYGTCKVQYLSNGISDSLGCNPSGGVASAAQQNGFNDATPSNSFGFHYCDGGSCVKTMCSGQYCSSSLSYMDYTQPFGYTLCKK